MENDLDGTTVLTSKALAGYLETASGRSLVFAAFVNNVPLDAPKPNRSISEATAEAGRLLGKLCEVLYFDAGDEPGSARSGRDAGLGNRLRHARFADHDASARSLALASRRRTHPARSSVIATSRLSVSICFILSRNRSSRG